MLKYVNSIDDSEMEKLLNTFWQKWWIVFFKKNSAESVELEKVVEIILSATNEFQKDYVSWSLVYTDRKTFSL